MKGRQLAALAARRVARLLAAAALIYGAIVAAAWWGQEWLIFRPRTLPAEHVFRVPADVYETWFEVEGSRLNALHLKRPSSVGVVFYLHGNGGSLEQWWIDPTFWRPFDLDVVMIDYRGYGKSPGRIASQEQLLADVRAVWRELAPAYAGKKRVFYGRSLGTGLAIQLAAALPQPDQPDLMVLVSPYESLLRLKREHYPLLPDAALRYPMRNDLVLPAVASPVLMFHGEEDTTITPAHAETLLALARNGRLHRVAGAGHNDVHRSPPYRQVLGDALRELVAGAR